MILEWSEDAILDAGEIFDFLLATTRNPDELYQHLISTIGTLPDWPHIGHKGSVEDTRELLTWPGPYRIVYYLTEDAVRIVRILHGKRPWPA